MPTIFDKYEIHFDGNNVYCDYPVVIGVNGNNSTKLIFDAECGLEYFALNLNTGGSIMYTPINDVVTLTLSPGFAGQEYDCLAMLEAGNYHLKISVVETPYFHDEHTEEQADDNTAKLEKAKAGLLATSYVYELDESTPPYTKTIDGSAPYYFEITNPDDLKRCGIVGDRTVSNSGAMRIHLTNLPTKPTSQQMNLVIRFDNGNDAVYIAEYVFDNVDSGDVVDIVIDKLNGFIQAYHIAAVQTRYQRIDVHTFVPHQWHNVDKIQIDLADEYTGMNIDITHWEYRTQTHPELLW